MINKIESNLKILRQTKPLVLSLTNYVTMDFMANTLLALGAAPIMSEERQEIEELIKISSVVNINIGTLTGRFIEKAKFACILAKKYNKPIILDPVGVGASKIRTETAKELLPFIDIIRGNASEIIAIAGISNETLGVESTHEVSDAVHAAKELASQQNKIIIVNDDTHAEKDLALKQNKVVIVTGAEDFITDGNRDQTLNFGSSMMPLVTGMGCTLAAVIAAFRAVVPDSFEATRLATTYFNLSGQIAEYSYRLNIHIYTDPN